MKNITIIRQVKNIIDVLFSPSKVFNEINKTPFWLIVFIFITIGTIFIRLLYDPFMKRISLVSMSSELSSEQAGWIAQSAKSLTIVSATLSPFYLIIKFIIISVVLWIIISFFSDEADFKKIFSVVVHCGIITFLGSVLTLIILQLRGVDSIKSATDVQVSLGLDIFLQNPDLSLPLKAFLSNINVFSIWWIVLITLGISITSKISRTKATLIAIFFWLFSTAIQVGIASLIGSLWKIG